jgi:DNA-binding phage protein
MMKSKYDRMIDQFNLYYPDLSNRVVDWWPSGRIHITVKLNDGMMFEFNSYDHCIRRVLSSDYSNDAEALKKNIGHNLEKVILARGLSHAEIAERSGVTPAMLSRYIHGNSMPGIDKVYALASVLGCRIVDILGESYEEYDT